MMGADTKAKAVVLVSGGLDSATCLAIANSRGYACLALSFDYGQRSLSELAAAKKVAARFEVSEHKVIKLDIGSLGGSSLTDHDIPVPESAEEGGGQEDREGEEKDEGENENIPSTYVPARNTVFLSYALAYAEVAEAEAIFIGVNALDYSGYPDCRPAFVKAFQQLINVATRAGVEGRAITLETPLIDLSKAEIIKAGERLGVDFGLTVSCYQADSKGRACGVCDSCRFRKQGFAQAGVEDPTRYQS